MWYGGGRRSGQITWCLLLFVCAILLSMTDATPQETDHGRLRYFCPEEDVCDVFLWFVKAYKIRDLVDGCATICTFFS